ncbi:hypothetical protein FJ934_11645 [Mesorhizobium sp. B2-4-12]|uniref:hypothetical protein n=1 Tax=unclassified Mesorhizobium TaxID=325217 RepID=UPI0011266DC3|nr:MULTISPECIES: hypothetical protein [unclassified Mesorhizobium]TPK82578.1 hypothetical protein FJ548_19880 [Mesorhizobium sp. B2-4-17]TPK95562.1 hypothetical protein FJ934_11645 [Mesorhizobium sp. B2-4-12]
MSYKKIQTKGAYTDFTIRDADIDKTFDPLKGRGKPSEKWVLGLVNITNEVYSFASVAGPDGNYGKWFEISETGNNCETNYDECIGNGQWSAILAVPSNSPPFSIRIATRPNQFDKATGTEFFGITPNKTHEGGIIGIS